MKKLVKQGLPRKQRELPVSLPSIINMDELATMTDDALIERLRGLESDKDKVITARFDARLWETEACYVRRELQLRRSRHQHHEAFLVQLDREADELQRIENTYPVADLDNSAFMIWS